MHRRVLVFALALTVALPFRAGAEPQPDVLSLTAEQIALLLTGNTIEGTWSGTAYRQYFAPGGMTVYLPEGGQPDQGKWRTNAAQNTYESWWRMTSWTGYTVVMTNRGYAWKNGDTLEPFAVLEGRQVSW